MAKIGKSMSVASRLAAATALTGTLMACDTRLGRFTESIVSPSGTAEQIAQRAPTPAAPGNPVPLGGSQSANDALYQQTYGAPLNGSGQVVLPQSTVTAPPVYQDNAISVTPITDIPGGPVIDAGRSFSAPVYTPEVTQYSAPVSAQPIYSPVAVAPSPQVISTNVSNVSYLPQSAVVQPALPQSPVLPRTAFTDASAVAGGRDIESVLATEQMTDVPYGSTASHRYSVAEQTLPAIPQYSALPEYTPQQYSMPLEIMETEALPMQPVAIAPQANVEVAALGGAFVPMPRARPQQIGPVFDNSTVVAQRTPLPTLRPKTLFASPLPNRRPVQMVALSGQAAPLPAPSTETPKMIEVDAIFIDEEPSSQIETSALAPIEPVDQSAEDTTKLTIIEPEVLDEELAALDQATSSVPRSPVRVEIADDVGDLKELSGTSWRLASLRGKDVPASAELHFDGTSGFAGGQGICNNYGGEYSETLKGAFQMGDIFSTEMECEHTALEKQYIVALESAEQYRMSPGLRELMLVDPDGSTVATFTAF